MSTTYWKMTVQLNAEKDAALISYLERQANKNDAVRRALRAQMEAEE